jgi:hypothetical protein
MGTLIYWGKLEMKYYDLNNDGFNVCFKDTEIETAKDIFNVGKHRTVKTGGVWLKNHLKNKK